MDVSGKTVALCLALATLALTQDASSCKNRSCFDYVNECGKPYGGCVDMCGGTFSWPSFTKPACPATAAVQQAQVTGAPAALQFSSAARLGPAVTRTTTGCSETICIDAINDCGIWYGGCFPICSGYPRPSPTPPPCPASVIVPAYTPSAAVTTISIPHLLPGTDCDQIVCLDYKNACDVKYGGCFPICGGVSTPVYTDPGCPVSTSQSGDGLRGSTMAASQAARVTSITAVGIDGGREGEAPPVTTLDLRWGSN